MEIKNPKNDHFCLDIPQRDISNISKIQNRILHIRLYILNSNVPIFCQFFRHFFGKIQIIEKKSDYFFEYGVNFSIKNKVKIHASKKISTNFLRGIRIWYVF